MTPERIAELRQHGLASRYDLAEVLDEIECLQGIVSRTVMGLTAVKRTLADGYAISPADVADSALRSLRDES